MTNSKQTGADSGLTAAQRRALQFAASWYGLRDGSIEQGIQVGITGAAIESVIRSLERRGYVSGAYADITQSGRLALAPPPQIGHESHCMDNHEDEALFERAISESKR